MIYFFFNSKLKKIFKTLAIEKDWHYQRSDPLKISGKCANGINWAVRPARTSSYNFAWQAKIQLNRERLFITTKGGSLITCIFSPELKRFKYGSSKFQHKYYTAANNNELLKYILTSEIQFKLLNWPTVPFRYRKVHISLKNNRLKILTYINYKEQDFINLIQFGELFLLRFCQFENQV